MKSLSLFKATILQWGEVTCNLPDDFVIPNWPKYPACNYQQTQLPTDAFYYYSHEKQNKIYAQVDEHYVHDF